MGRRRNPSCTCNACCPRASIIYDEPTCSVTWSAASCCGAEYVDNQRYYLAALNDDATTYIDYGDVGSSGTMVAVRGKRYRLTVTGPDCYLDRVYYASVPSSACRDCAPDCTPNVPYTTLEVSGCLDWETPWTIFDSSGSYYKYRKFQSLLNLNHTKIYPTFVDLGSDLCPRAYMLGERYFIATVQTRTEVIVAPGAPWQGPLLTAASVWDVYGFFDQSIPTRSPGYRMSFVLQSWNEVSVFSNNGPSYLRAPLMPTKQVLFSPAVGALTGYRVSTSHTPRGFTNGAMPAWCATPTTLVFFPDGLNYANPGPISKFIGSTL